MFIAILTYKKPLEEVDRFLQAHRDYLAEHYTAGDFIASGPQTPRVGGVIMIKAENRTAVDAIIMPYISIESGWLTAEQKKQLIERLTATASEIAHIPEQFFIVTIKELPDENFGIVGKSIDEIKRNYQP